MPQPVGQERHAGDAVVGQVVHVAQAVADRLHALETGGGATGRSGIRGGHFPDATRRLDPWVNWDALRCAHARNLIDRVAAIYDETRGGERRGNNFADDLAPWIVGSTVVELAVGTGVIVRPACDATASTSPVST